MEGLGLLEDGRSEMEDGGRKTDEISADSASQR